jgi:glutaredoxin 3
MEWFLGRPIFDSYLILNLHMKEVTIYTTPTCGYCKMAKEFFAANNVAFTEYNVGTDLEKRKEMIDRSGQMGVPVIFIDSEMTVGFDKNRLTTLLGL